MTGPSLFVMDDIQTVKEGLLRSLQKLNDRDTNRTAIDEMHEIIEKYLNPDLMNFTVSALCQCGDNSMPWVRKEAMRLIAYLTSSKSPHAGVVLSNPAMVGKICAYMKTRMNDADGGVREAFAEVLGSLSQNYHVIKHEPLPCSHPFFKISLDGLQAAKKESQVAAGSALCASASYTGVLDTAIVKHLLRLLVTQAFHAKQHVMASFANWDPEKRRGGGFVTLGADGLVPSIGAIIGNVTKPSAAGIGCLGCLSNQDWAVRKGAADALLAMNRLLGPDVEQNAAADRQRVPRCLDALIKAKHDRVKPVRVSIADTIAAYEELAAWMHAHPGGSLLEWRRSIAGGGVSGRTSPAGSNMRASFSGASSALVTTRVNAAVVRSSEAFERFRAQHSAADVIRTAVILPGGQPAAHFDGVERIGDASSAITLPTSRPANLIPVQDSGDLPPGAGAAPCLSGRSSGLASDAGDGMAQMALRHIEQLHKMLASMSEEVGSALERLSGRVTSDLDRLDKRLVALEGRLEQPAGKPATMITNPWFRPEGADTVDLAMGGGSSNETGARSPEEATAPLVAAVRRGAAKAAAAAAGLDSAEDAVDASIGRRQLSNAGSIGRHVYTPGAAPGKRSSVGSRSARESVSVATSRHVSETGAGESGQGAAAPEGFEWPDAKHIVARASQGSDAPSSPVAGRPASPATSVQPALQPLEEEGEDRAEASPAHSAATSAASGRELSARGGKSSGDASPARSVASRAPSPGAPSPLRPGSPPLLESSPGTAGASGDAPQVAGSATNTRSSVAPGALLPGARASVSTVTLAGMTPAEVDAAYSKCLKCASPDELGVLRLMQKTGPAWHVLSPQTAQLALGVFNKWLRNGSNLARLRPWLFQLADEDAVCATALIPSPARAMTLASVTFAASKHDSQLALLRDTLAAAWASPSRRRPPGAPATGTELTSGSISAPLKQRETSAYTTTLPDEGEDSILSIGGLTDPDDSGSRALPAPPEDADLRKSISSIRRIPEPFRALNGGPYPR